MKNNVKIFQKMMEKSCVCDRIKLVLKVDIWVWMLLQNWNLMYESKEKNGEENSKKNHGISANGSCNFRFGCMW